MSFLVSPGVHVKEIDLTNVVPSVDTTIGALAGVFLLSCSVVAPAWDGVKDGTETVVTTGEDVIVSVYQGGKGLIGDGVTAVEGAIEGGYELVTSPFTEDEE